VERRFIAGVRVLVATGDQLCLSEFPGPFSLCRPNKRGRTELLPVSAV
jgi:hypothetical protein